MGSSTTVLGFGEIMMRLSPKEHLRIEQALEFDVRYGGAEANAALSLAYQGDDSAFVSVVPPNRVGDCALRSLKAYGVDVSRVVREGDRLGSYIFEVGATARGNSCVYDRKYSAINLASHEVFDWEKILEGVGMFYFSGVTPAISDEMAIACEEALTVCRAKGITTVCDLNYRSKLWSAHRSQEVMKKLMPLVDVCIANDEDSSKALGIVHGSASLTCGIEEKDEYVKIAQDICRDYGVKVVASVVRDVQSVTESDWLGLYYEGATDSVWWSPIHHVTVLEGIAAGDAFGAGLVHAMLNEYDPQLAIDYAIAASVMKLGIKGDSNIVTEAEIMALAQSASGEQRVDR